VHQFGISKTKAILKKKADIAYRFRPHDQSFDFYPIKTPKYIARLSVDE